MTVLRFTIAVGHDEPLRRFEVLATSAEQAIDELIARLDQDHVDAGREPPSWYSMQIESAASVVAV